MIFFNLKEEVTDEIINSRTRNIGALLKNKTLKKIKSNDYPILLLQENLSGDIKDDFDKNLNLYESKSNLITSSSNFVMNVNQYLVDQLADYQVDSRDYISASEHVDEMLYSGFTGPSDWKILEEIKILDDSNNILTNLERLEDKRLIELYKRKLYSDNKNLLTEGIIENQKKYIREKIFNESEKVTWTTLAKARSELNKISQDERFKSMSDEIKKIERYLDKIEKNFS